jgi:hypothetical protein
MTQRYIPVAAMLAFASFASLAPTANAQMPATCAADVPIVPAYPQSHGSALIGDIFLICIGGTALPVGASLPTINLTVFLDTNVLPSTQPLVSIDSPGLPLSNPVNLCSSLDGAGPSPGCGPILNPASPGTPYDGLTGHFNEFLGTTDGNAVTFFAVPIEFPGPTGTLLIDVSGISFDTTAFTPPLSSPDEVLASVSVNSSTALPISNPTLVVAVITPEPATWPSLAIGLGGVALLRLRRTKRNGWRLNVRRVSSGN